MLASLEVVWRDSLVPRFLCRSGKAPAVIIIANLYALPADWFTQKAERCLVLPGAPANFAG
jgi:hypothetical protein